MRNYDRIARAVFETPWFIREREGRIVAEIVLERVAGDRLSEEDIHARVSAAQAAQGPRRGPRVAGAVAVIPIYGVIMPRVTLMTEMSGGSTVAGIREAFREVLADEAVGSILFDVDSPGGAVDGIEELATEIREARGRKPMVAIANTLMASAAYYVACQADEVVASPSSLTGSIGVFLEHVEFSRADEAEGVTATVIRRPAGKHEVNAVEPLSDDARSHLQEMIDDYYGQFVGAVAKGRGVTPAVVRAGYGEGRVLTARRALEAGLVDRVETYDEALRRLATGKGPAPRATAADLPTVAMSDDDLRGALGLDERHTVELTTDSVLDAIHPPRERATEAKAALALARAQADRR